MIRNSSYKIYKISMTTASQYFHFFSKQFLIVTRHNYFM